MSRARAGRATRPVLPAPCVPVGELAPPSEQAHTCRCGERVYPRREASRNEWEYATAAGERVRDDRPAALVADPAAWWARLAQVDINTYSGLKARVDLGYWSWFHPHDANSSTPLAPEDAARVPWCCGSPMWASPDGWACRVNRQLFPYDER